MSNRKAAEKMPEHQSSLNRYVHEFLSFIFSELNENAERMLRKLAGFMDFREKIRRYAIFLALVAAAIVVMLNGVSQFIGSLLPNLKPGLINIFLGAALMLFALAYRKIG